MKQPTQTRTCLLTFQNGLCAGLLLGACIAACGVFWLGKTYRKNMDYALRLCAGQYQLLEVELMPEEHLRLLGKLYGEVSSGLNPAEFEALKDNPDWIRGSVTSATYAALLKEQEGIPGSHPAKASYERTLELARHMLEKYGPTVERGIQQAYWQFPDFRGDPRSLQDHLQAGHMSAP